jgi:hypothetical protein
VNPAVGSSTPDDERDRTGRNPASAVSEPKYAASTAHRANGTESPNATVWPLSAMAIVIAVALLAFGLTRSPFAVVVISAVAGLVVVMRDHYTD